MFERFTDRARRVIVIAQEVARELNHETIDSAHLLAALCREGEAVAAQVLAEASVRDVDVQREHERLRPRPGFAPSGHIPFTPNLKRVLELALREALQLGHNYIGTEHLLLGADGSTMTQQVEALSKAVVGIDGSRRVGWAKAFAALEKVDTLEHDLGIKGEDRDIYRDKFSFAWGYLRRIMDDFGTPGSILNADIRSCCGVSERVDEDGVLNHAQARAGVEAAHEALVAIGRLSCEGVVNPEAYLLRRAERQAKRKQAKKDATREQEDVWLAKRIDDIAREQALQKLAEETGYDSIAKLKKAVRNLRLGFVGIETLKLVEDRVVRRMVSQYGLQNADDLHSALEAWPGTAS